MDKHLADARRYDAVAPAEVIDRIVRHLSGAPNVRDAATVACSDERELRTVGEHWCRSRLGADDSAAIERTLELVCETMARDRMKNRATFYYLCAKHLRKVDAI